MAALKSRVALDACSDRSEKPAQEASPASHAAAEIERDDELASQLAKTIEGEIIPRLLLAHKAAFGATPRAAMEPGFDADEVQEFGGLVLAADVTRAYAFLNRSRALGRPLESIIMDLLAPAASYLGELWKADRCSFTEVTVGLSRLRQMLRELGPDFESETHGWRHGRRALLIPTPGEQHTFGLFVVETFFRREGWDVTGGLIDSAEEIAHLVSQQWFAVAGFSLSCERHLDRLAPIIRAVRRSSCNGDIGVLVGGPLFLDKPELAIEVGADASATDGRMAVLRARSLLARSAAHG